MSSKQSIELYESLKRLTKPQFGEVCLLLEYYSYNLTFVTREGVPMATSAQELFHLVKQNPQGITHLSEAIDKVASPQKANSFHNILFYLPDRKPQKDELRKAIEAYRVQYPDKKQRPLLCLIHGDENEYGNFVKCLLGNFLLNDNALSEYFRNGLFEIELLLEEFHTVDKLHQEILDSLVKNKINAKPEKKAIAHELAMKRCPIIIHVRLQSKDLEDWQDDDKTVLDGFIEFWADWPKKVYAQHQLFLVFLSFSYEGRKNNFSVVNWFRRKKSRKATNSALLNQFESLNKKFPTIRAFFESEKVHAKVLQKLDSVKRIQACNWIGNYEDQIRKFCNDTYALERQVKALYKNRDAIPMEELARELEILLNNPNN